VVRDTQVLLDGKLVTQMKPNVNRKEEQRLDKSHLSERDVRLLLVVCTELVNFCASVTGQIDPAAAAMLAYVRDDILSESKLKLPYS
jgi:hypothetical protein